MTHLLLYTTDENSINNTSVAKSQDCDVIFDFEEALSYVPSEVMILVVLNPLIDKESIQALIAREYPIILLSNLPTTEEALAWFALGVKGYLNLYASEERIRQAIDVVESGNIWLGQNVMQALITQATSQPQVSEGWKELVTEREDETLKLVMQGLSNMEIAEAMHISERTVKAHISHLLEKFSVKDRLALVLCIQNWQT
ncbi:response regulator transcription factor [Hydrogenovibrio kuenenii]|uniref:response regulator transcription factor n=1 Tax=Hydrogenovibrio kuenenii TaxID=63658 RepID=UPI000465A8C0|nr:response regulator transcription factor [Hydrogenovibrio kuenenii]